MSRFARSQGGTVHTWSPPESPLRIEYTPALLREIRNECADVDAFGVLYGVLRGNTVSFIATRGRAGLDPIGVFASRVRGKVFLTEEDLERFDRAEACVALVISGESGGFFVRDAAGSIETVRSYEEFSLAAPKPLPVVVPKHRNYLWLALALIPLICFTPRHRQPPIAVSLREDSGQVRISWNVPNKATLTILDGGEKTSIALTPAQSTATYARRSGNVTVRIGKAEGRFVGPALPPTKMEQMRASVKALESKVASLRSERADGQTKIAALERSLQ